MIQRAPTASVPALNRLIRKSVVALALFLAGAACGYNLFSGLRRGPGEITHPPKPEDADMRASGPSGVTSASSDVKVQRLLAAARRKGGAAIERQNELYLTIEALTADDFPRLLMDPGALKAMTEDLSAFDQESAKGLSSGLVGRWLEVDPQGAIKWLPRVFEIVPKRSRDLFLDAVAAKRPEALLALVSAEKKASERADIISRALVELAATDLPKAHAWLNACSDPADRQAAEKALRRGIARADPLRGMQIAAEISDRQERSEVASVAAEEAAQIGPGMLRQLAMQPMKSWMLPRVLEYFAEHDPVTAVDLALNSVSEEWEKYGAVQTAFGALAKRDPALAVSKLDGLQGTALAGAVAKIGYEWSLEQPEAALAWLAAKPLSERTDPSYSGRGTQDALLIAFSEWADSTPDAARAWADALPPGEMRDAVQTQRARRLAAKGQMEEASRILSQLGSSADPNALSAIASAWAERDPNAAADWAINQPAGPRQEKAIASVVGTWANEDPQSAAAWLEQFPAGEARDRSIFAYLGRSTLWLSPNETQVAEFDRWFDQIDSPWQRSQAAVRNYYTRRMSDPEGARQWLLSVQNIDAALVKMALSTARR